jgi:hypothetical protein
LPKTECLVAVHADTCCSPAIPVTAESMSADPCLVPYGLEFLPATLAACPEAARCQAVDCVFQPPPSRIAAPNPDVAGACRFVNECEIAEDCVVATDLRGCCGCPMVFPKALALANPCISPPGPPPGLACNTCTGVVCSPCPAPFPLGGCSSSGEYRTCVQDG